MKWNGSLSRLKLHILLFCATLLLFQNPLERVYSGFSWIDELFALLGGVLVLLPVIRRGTLRFSRSSAWLTLCLAGFLGTGLLGNLLFQYQPLSSVAVDVYTNLKFFLALAGGKSLVENRWETEEALAQWGRRMARCILLLFLLDLFTHCFPSKGQRYGLRAVQLIWSHPTYLAGAMVFLLGVLTLCYRRENRSYMLSTLLVLLSTLRSKALAAGVVYAALLYFVMIRRKPLKLRHMLLAAAGTLAVAWKQFFFYYIRLRGHSARSVLTQTALKIARDYFPIGTGFASYGSSEAAKHYSPVYRLYGFLRIQELDGKGGDFFSDTFWPIILGQTGCLGLLCYLLALGILFRRTVICRKDTDLRGYALGLFLFAYLFISSTSEPAFNNAIAVPLAMLLGALYHLPEKEEKL